MLYCIALYCVFCPELYCTVLSLLLFILIINMCTQLHPDKDTIADYTIIYCNTLVVLYCTVLYCTVLYCTVMYCTVMYCTVLYCTVLYLTVLFSSSVPPLTIHVCVLCVFADTALFNRHKIKNVNILCVTLKCLKALFVTNSIDLLNAGTF